MKFKAFLGIDVSKLVLDLCLISEDGSVESFKINNRTSYLRKFFDDLAKICSLKDVLVCAEYTGHYSNPLRAFCTENRISLWLESGAEIKHRSGIQRYKNDKVDAERIAEYAKRHQDRARLQTANEKVVRIAKLLTTEREMYIRDRAKYKAQLKDFKEFIEQDCYKRKSIRLKRQIRALTKLIEQIEGEIKGLFQENDKLSEQKKVLMSIDGIGEQVATQTIIATEAFTKFNRGRKFACHVGVAPFSFESGSSQRSRRKVSHRANKDLKRLYHMAALSAIKMEGEFREYYLRKVEEGKNKMSVINAVRAKLINRIFAVIRDNRKYSNTYINHLTNP